MLRYKGYSGIFEADEDGLVGRVSGIRDIVTFEARTLDELVQAFHDSVDDYLAFCAERLPDQGNEPGSAASTIDRSSNPPRSPLR